MKVGSALSEREVRVLTAKTLATAFVIGLLVIASANAQIPLGSGQDLAPPPTNLAVEVYYYPKQPPAYMTVSPSKSPPMGSWFSRFGRVPGWTASAEFPTINAVDIRPVLSGDLVRITISVLFGKLNEQDKPVAVYTLREGEKARVQELSKFGVEPFELALVRVAPVSADLPQVISKLKSIELVTIQANLSTLASHRLILRNVSNKNVRTITIRVLQGDHLLLSGGREGKEGKPLILAGGVCEITSRGATRASATPGGYKPVTPENQTIEISMAFFEDGSFEGDTESAAIFGAALKGSRAQLGRIVRLVQEALQDNPSDPSSLLESLRKQVEGLNNEPDPVAVQDLVNEFPGLAKKSGDLKDVIQVEMRLTKKDVQDEIRRFQLQNPTLDSNSLSTWLLASKQRYEAWLSRL